jgi:hypothetical protein
LLIIFSGITLYLKSVTGLIAIIAVFYFAKRNLPTTHNWLFLISSGLAFIAILNLSAVKGRLHTLQISTGILMNHFPNRLPSYNFAYNHTQIEYFKYYGTNTKDAYLANEGIYALNDILQITILQGWVGLIIIITLFSIFLMALLQSLKYPARNNLHSSVILIIPFYIFVLASYPLQVPIFAAVFIIFHLPLLSYYLRVFRFKRFYIVIQIMLTSIAMVFVILVAINIANSKKSNNKLNGTIKIWDAGFHNKSLQQLNSLENKLGDKQKFIYYKALYLHLSGNSKDASNFLLANHTKGCSYDFHILSGDVFKEIKYSSMAISEYQNALYLVPHKLESRYKLMQIYNYIQKNDSASFYAKDILMTPIKVNNVRANFYQLKARELVQ